MKTKLKVSEILLLLLMILGFSGCATMPTGFLKLSEDSLENRQLQVRQYDTGDEIQIMQATTGVLQDLGFILDSSEAKLGFVGASKKADATSVGQVLLLAFFGGANAVKKADSHQILKASVITRPSLEGKKIVVRVTFQRIVWNKEGNINRVESIKDLEVYQKFYDSLSKAIFLEAQEI